MRVLSLLAEIDFVIGELVRDGDTLIIKSAPSSSIAAEVRMTPRDAAHMLGSIILNPTAIVYFLSLPFLLQKRRYDEMSGDGVLSDSFVKLNNPWLQ
jgi:hypothetical protein